MYDKFMFLYGGHGDYDDPKYWDSVYKLDCETYEWERIHSTSSIKP